MKYLEDSFKVTAVKRTYSPKYGMCADGYTKRCGAPTSYMVQLDGSKRWRRVMCWQFSNAGTLFVRVNKEEYIVRFASTLTDKE